MLGKPCRKTKSIFTARLIVASNFHIGKRDQIVLCYLNALGGNGVVHPLAFLAPGDDAGITEDLHVVG